MENGDLLTATSQVFLQFGAWMLLAVAVLGAMAGIWLYRNQSERQRDMQRELQALRYEIDDHQMHPRRPTGQAGGQGSGQMSTPMSGHTSTQPVQAHGTLTAQAPAKPLNRMQADLELQAYQKIWASVRDLHDKLGAFLRAIETGEPAGDSRMAARTAALKAKDCAQRLRPFYPENIEAVVFQLIDNEVHMHLSACAYLSLRDESKLIYDGECRQQLNTLVQAIRYRLSNQQVVE